MIKKGDYRLLYWLEMKGLTLNIIHYMNITMPLKNFERQSAIHIKIRSPENLQVIDLYN